jgi:DNA-binding transcriptional LysR family regulator
MVAVFRTPPPSRSGDTVTKLNSFPSGTIPQASFLFNMRYTLRQIEYFIATAETGSITLASERLSISQPSISTAITHLEGELETQLFVRHHAKGLSLTTAGRSLLVEAKMLIQQAERIYTLASEVNEKIRGQLSLGCLVTLASMIMPELSHSFTTAFPATRIIPTVCDHEALLEKLDRAELDVAITYDLIVPDGFEFVPLARLPPYALVGETSPLARLSSLSLSQLAAEPLILLDLPISREYFLSLFAAAGVKPTIGGRAQHQDVIRTMVANNYGYALFNVRPRSDLAMDGRRVLRIPLSADHRPMIVGLCLLKQTRQLKLIEAFKRHCQSFVSDSYIPGMIAPAFDRKRQI